MAVSVSSADRARSSNTTTSSPSRTGAPTRHATSSCGASRAIERKARRSNEPESLPICAADQLFLEHVGRSFKLRDGIIEARTLLTAHRVGDLKNARLLRYLPRLLLKPREPLCGRFDGHEGLLMEGVGRHATVTVLYGDSPEPAVPTFGTG